MSAPLDTSSRSVFSGAVLPECNRLASFYCSQLIGDGGKKSFDGARRKYC